MSRQPLITNYLEKKGIKPDNRTGKKTTKKEHHESSRENSMETEKLGDSNDCIILETFEYHRMVGPSFILLTPSIMVYYRGLERKLKDIVDNYSKDKVMDFILENLKFHKIDNLNNLKSIKDDDFWGIGLPAMIELTYAHIKDIEATLRILVSGYSEVVEVSRRQCFVVLACMFLGILPRQMHEDQVSLG
jgi:hypothetical protein